MSTHPEGYVPGATLLGLPLRARRETLAVFTALALYLLLTMSRDLSFYDSAELALAAVQPGLSHPIGQPLHTLIGFLLAHLPLVPALVGINVLSALPAALSVIPATSIAEGLLAGAGLDLRADSPAWARAAAPVTVAVCALHAVAWEPATRVEVYTLASFFALWSCARASGLLGARDSSPRAWLGVGIALGLSASSNAFVAITAALALVPALAGGLVRKSLSVRAALLLVAGGVLGLAPYAYVLLVAHSTDAAARFVWGLPASAPALRHYLTGADYAENTGITAGTWLRHVGAWLAWSAQNALVPVMAGGIAAHVLWGKSRGGRALAGVCLALAVAIVNANSIWFLDNPDYLGYLAAPLGLCAAGAAALVARGALSPSVRARVYAGAGLAALFAATLVSPPGVFSRARGGDRVARAMAEGALDEAPRGAVLIVESDHWVFPVLYAQEAEGRRRDVVVLAYGLLHSSWYWEHVFRLHPELRATALRGPGGREGRVRRLLDANAGRAVLFERGRIARDLGLSFCAVGWLLSTEGCGADGVHTRAVTESIEAWLARVDDGRSPASDGVLTQVAFDRGEALWRLGRGVEAWASLEAGVPRAMRAVPALAPATQSALESVRPLQGPPVTFRDFSALGQPARNLFLAARLLAAAGDRDAARRESLAAANLGLPEATEW